MPIKHGANDVVKIYHGADEVVKIYHGADVVYENTSVIIEDVNLTNFELLSWSISGGVGSSVRTSSEVWNPPAGLKIIDVEWLSGNQNANFFITNNSNEQQNRTLTLNNFGNQNVRLGVDENYVTLNCDIISLFDEDSVTLISTANASNWSGRTCSYRVQNDFNVELRITMEPI